MLVLMFSPPFKIAKMIWLMTIISLFSEHLEEIFTTFGKVKEIEFGSERSRPWLNRGTRRLARFRMKPK